jgi:cytochrome c553
MTRATFYRMTPGATMRRRCSIALLALVVACDKTPPPPPPPATAPAPFKAVVTTRQLMEEVIEPAANVYWESVGSVTDRRGTVDKAPKSAAEWDAVRNAATVVAESGNLLILEARARNRDEWMTLARALVEMGERARKAAESRDSKAVFDAGAELYESCVSCHAIYLVGPKATTPPK